MANGDNKKQSVLRRYSTEASKKMTMCSGKFAFALHGNIKMQLIPNNNRKHSATTVIVIHFGPLVLTTKPLIRQSPKCDSRWWLAVPAYKFGYNFIEVPVGSHLP
ncbi:hypothetical protein TNCV_3987691 [Trichonephila clavipes]|nr:hypothetical protein TNCV_3987691 [Trichonephila clavipes]